MQIIMIEYFAWLTQVIQVLSLKVSQESKYLGQREDQLPVLGLMKNINNIVKI